MRGVVSVMSVLSLCALARGEGRPEEAPEPMPEVSVLEFLDVGRGVFLDTCADAATLSNPAMFTFNNSAADPGLPVGSCNGSGASVMQNDVWFKWTPTIMWTATVSLTELSSFDMILSVYEGACGQLTELLCHDDPEPISRSFLAIPGRTYYFQVGDWGPTPGGGLARLDLGGTPFNGTCANPLHLDGYSDSMMFDNRTAGADPRPGTCNSASATVMQNASWFRWEAPANGIAHLKLTEHTAYDMMVQVWSGPDCDNLTPVACGDDPEPINIGFNVLAGEVLWFQCGDWGLTAGGGLTEIRIDLTAPHDTCAEAGLLGLGTPFAFDNRAANAGAPAGFCNSVGTTEMQNDVWFQWTAPMTMEVAAVVDSPAFDGMVAVHVGGCGSPVEIACGDDPEPTTVPFTAYEGETYFIQVGDWGALPGGGEGTITMVPLYENETCGSAKALFRELPLTESFLNVGAADGLPRGSCNRQDVPGPAMVSDLWWRWTAPAPGVAEFTVTTPSTWQALIAVYGGSCGSLVELGCAADPNYVGACSVQVAVQAGVEYLVQVGDWGNSQGGGFGELSITYLAPENDLCADAILISEGTTYGHNIGAGNDGSATCGDGHLNHEVWYRYDAPTNGHLTVSTCGTNDWFGTDLGMDTVLSLHTLACPVFNQWACSDDAAACGQQGQTFDSLVSMNVQQGQSLLIQVGEFSTSGTGVFQLHLTLDPLCYGDTNGDLLVNFTDLETLLEGWNTSVAPWTNGDVNGDGFVNFSDLELVLEEWGANCN